MTLLKKSERGTFPRPMKAAANTTGESFILSPSLLSGNMGCGVDEIHGDEDAREKNWLRPKGVDADS